MDKHFFCKTRILDGGMGQELLKRGLKPRGTLWSAEALIKEQYHQLIIDTHLDFIYSGAEVIVTNTFTSRKGRLIQNNCLEYFEKINKKAVELALRARDISKKNILIAGGLPNQKQTYSADLGNDLTEVKLRFEEQAFLLKDNIDLFYLDVMGSSLECKIALESINKYNLPFSLISDEKKEVLNAYGVWGPKKFMGRTFDGINRTTFIIDEEGKIINIIEKVKTKEHASQIL